MKKRILSIVLAVMLLCSIMSINAFADNEYTVTIYFEKVTRDDDDEQTVLSQTVLHNGNPISVDVDANSSLKAAIIEAVQTYPLVLSGPAWTNDGQYLKELTIDNILYRNQDSFDYDENTGLNIYVGKSWMYFIGVPSDIPDTTYDYPSVSLLNATVSDDVTITLSYETLTFTW